MRWWALLQSAVCSYLRLKSLVGGLLTRTQYCAVLFFYIYKSQTIFLKFYSHIIVVIKQIITTQVGIPAVVGMTVCIPQFGIWEICFWFWLKNNVFDLWLQSSAHFSLFLVLQFLSCLPELLSCFLLLGILRRPVLSVGLHKANYMSSRVCSSEGHLEQSLEWVLSATLGETVLLLKWVEGHWQLVLLFINLFNKQFQQNDPK